MSGKMHFFLHFSCFTPEFWEFCVVLLQHQTKKGITMKKLWPYIIFFLCVCVSSCSSSYNPPEGGYNYDYNSLCVYEYPSHHKVYYIKDITLLGTTYWEVYEAGSYNQVYYVKLITHLGSDTYELYEYSSHKQLFYCKHLTLLGTEYWEVYEAGSYHQVYYVKLITRLGSDIYEVYEYPSHKQVYYIK